MVGYMKAVQNNAIHQKESLAFAYKINSIIEHISFMLEIEVMRRVLYIVDNNRK